MRKDGLLVIFLSFVVPCPNIRDLVKSIIILLSLHHAHQSHWPAHLISLERVTVSLLDPVNQSLPQEFDVDLDISPFRGLLPNEADNPHPATSDERTFSSRIRSLHKIQKAQIQHFFQK
jgi:hypothetical protein